MSETNSVEFCKVLFGDSSETNSVKFGRVLLEDNSHKSVAATMNRQGGDDIIGNESDAKGKKLVAAEEEVAVGHGGEGGGLTEEEEWLWRRWGEGGVVVDEQMWWGTCWDPCWDVGIMGGEAYYNELYNDVLWEDDVWDLKQIKDVPIMVGRSSVESTVEN